MTTKYLSDGRKVAVIGALNNEESIVQEIFVTADGAEIPSGERFTVRSLHDEPVLSYKEKEAVEMEKHISSLKSDYKKAEKKYAEFDQKLKVLSEVVRQSERMIKMLPEADLEVFSQFITGSIKFAVLDNRWDYTPPQPLIGMMETGDRANSPSLANIKLLSVFGDTNGAIRYTVHRYGYGSSADKTIYPFTSEADALLHIQERAQKSIDEGEFCSESYQKCVDMGIVFSTEYRTKYKEKEISKIRDAIARCSQNLNEEEEEIDAYNSEIEKLQTLGE